MDDINVGRQEHQNTITLNQCIEEAQLTGTEIPDSTALTIASWWGSPGPIGQELARLAQTGKATLDDLLEDIANTRNSESMDDDDSISLDMLCTWAIHAAKRETSR